MRRVEHWVGGVLLSALVFAGCASKNKPAPVEDRSPNSAVRAPVKALAGVENAGRAGFYTVKPGDTLIRIGMDNGQSWRDIARWNNLENPNLIETGQVLRVVPLEETGVVVRPVSSTTVVTSPAPSQVASAPAASTSSTSKPNSSLTSPPSSSQPVSNMASADSPEEAVSFQWPARGNLLAGFDEVKNKGIDIAGKAGDPVAAAADGKVVYAGAGLRGYGNLVIIKHNNTFLTAYAHNQSLLVKEDQAIKRGQKIAEMGNSDTDQVKLHFEIRRQGKPVDPAKYLPAN